VKKTPVLYFPVNVSRSRMFEKAEMAPSTFAPHGSAYAAGYAGAAYIIKNLGYKKIVLLRARLRVRAGPVGRREDAMKKYGVTAEYSIPVGTSDFTPNLHQGREMNPDIP